MSSPMMICWLWIVVSISWIFVFSGEVYCICICICLISWVRPSFFRRVSRFPHCCSVKGSWARTSGGILSV